MLISNLEEFFGSHPPGGVHGRGEEDWKHVKEVRNETSKMIHLAKETHYPKLGHKLVYRKLGIKAYWTVLNRLINKKKRLPIPPLLEKMDYSSRIYKLKQIY